MREARLAVDLLPISRDAWFGAFPLIALTQVYAMTGARDAAVDELGTLLSSGASKELTADILQIDPIYDGLRNSSKFQSLLEKFRAP